MYSDAVDFETAGAPGGAPAQAPSASPIFSPWSDWRPSEISHHGADCCRTALDWLRAWDFTELRGDSAATGPRWLVERYDWGMLQYPAFWCDTVRRTKLDCGAFAALAFECLAARGRRVRRVQLVQQYSGSAAAHWRRTWLRGEAAPAWVGGEMIYHEGCAVESETRGLRIWDASSGCWMEPNQTSGYGSVRAVRVSGGGLADGARLQWGRHQLAAGEWRELPE